MHRGLLSRVFTPRRMNSIEPEVREFCARSLDPLVGSGGFDFIANLGAEMPMRTIGMLLGIPEDDQEAIRDRIDEGFRLEDGSMPEQSIATDLGSGFEEYVEWRSKHPSDDLMTELLNGEFEDESGDHAPIDPRGGLRTTSAWWPPPATRRRRASSAGLARCSPTIPSSARCWWTTPA